MPRGVYPRTLRPLAERLWARVVRVGTDECWSWTGCLNNMGYGYLQRGKRGEGRVLAHVAAWQLTHGPVPEGLELDHLCRVPTCVNPAHLEPVTHRENLLRRPRRQEGASA